MDSMWRCLSLSIRHEDIPFFRSLNREPIPLLFRERFIGRSFIFWMHPVLIFSEKPTSNSHQNLVDMWMDCIDTMVEVVLDGLWEFLHIQVCLISSPKVLSVRESVHHSSSSVVGYMTSMQRSQQPSENNTQNRFLLSLSTPAQCLVLYFFGGDGIL